MKYFNLLNRGNIYNGLMTIFILSFPFGFKVNTIMLYVLIGFFLIDKKKSILNKLKFVKKEKVIWCFVVVFLIQLMGTSYSNDLDEGLKKVVLWLPFLFLPSIILAEGYQYGHDKIFNIVKIAVPLVFTILCMLYYFSEDYVGMDRFVQIWFVDKIGMSQFYLIFFLLLSITLCVYDLSSKNLVLNTIIILVTSVFLVLMNNFTGILFLMISLILFFCKVYHIISIKVFIMLLSSLAIFIVVAAFFNNKLETKLAPLLTTSINIEEVIIKNKYTYTRNTLEHRIYIDYLILSDLSNIFPWGVGVGGTQSYLNEIYQNNTFLTGIRDELNAHNQYLQEYLKTGVFGVFFLIVLFYLLFLKSRQTDFYLSFYVLFFVIGCLVESYLNRYHGVIICSGFIPLLIFEKKVI